MKKTVKYILKRIKSNKKTAIILGFLAVIFSFLLFAGTLISYSLKKGIDNTAKRLGADVMLVPKGAKENAENLMLTGQRSTFYFDSSNYEKLKSIEGINEITAQCFLKSLSADCCSTEVEIVFFDKDTDFIVSPWIENKYKDKLNKNEVIVGYGIELEDDSIKLFGDEYKVVAKMAKTGTSLDNSVYFSLDSKKELIEKALEKGSFLTEEQKSEDLISSIFFNVDKKSSLSQVLGECHKKIGDSFDIVYPKELNGSFISNLGIIKKVISNFVILGGLLLFILLLTAEHIIIWNRKKEVALLRILGNKKKSIIKGLLFENLIVGLVGALIGIFTGSLILIPFSNWLGILLKMPYLGPDLLEYMIIIIAILILMAGIVCFASIFSILSVVNLEPYRALRREE